MTKIDINDVRGLVWLVFFGALAVVVWGMSYDHLDKRLKALERHRCPEPSAVEGHDSDHGYSPENDAAVRYEEWVRWEDEIRDRK